MSDDIISKLGPLSPLAGTWEGEKGDDTAPADNRSVEKNKFRERMTFTPIPPVKNHAQTLFGLRYATTAWRIGEADPFHEEVGYWLWDARENQIMRCFIVPRGVNVLAGGKADAGARSFKLAADVGSATYGISSNPYLDREFKTVRYELTVTVHDNDFFSYEEDTQLKIKGQEAIFHHIDKNTLQRAR